METQDFEEDEQIYYLEDEFLSERSSDEVEKDDSEVAAGLENSNKAKESTKVQEYESTNAFLKAHMKYGDCKCSICGKIFGGTLRLKRHLRTHCNIREYQCTKCPKAFVDRERLTCHMRVHSKETHKCSICNKIYKNRLYLQSHLQRHKEVLKKYECAICGKTFASYDIMKGHIIYIHYRKQLSTQKEKMCDICGKSFPNRDYIKHRNTHNYKQQPMDCIYCGKTLCNYVSLKKHSERYHHSLPVDPKANCVNCTICNKKFNKLQLLKEHFDAKHLIKQFECDTCGSKFELKSEFRDHIQINHVSEGIFPCLKCGKLFESRSKMNRHREDAHIEYKFVCNECRTPKTFSSEYYLSRHVESQHRNI